MRVDKLPEDVKSCILEFCEENDKEVPEDLDFGEALKMYFLWEGIIGYDTVVIDLVKAFKREGEL